MADPSDGTRDDGRDARIDELFAELRRSEFFAPEPAAPKRARRAAPKAPKVTPTLVPAADESPAAPTNDSSEEATDPAPNETPDEASDGTGDDVTAVLTVELTGDDLARDQCRAVVTPLLDDLVRVTKRVLQDEQNVLLDAGRRARSRVDPERLLPKFDAQRESWAEALAPALALAYNGGRASVGRSRRAARMPDRVVNEIANALVAPLRERLTVTLASVSARGPYESTSELHRELAGAVGARYREWRTADLETRLDDALAAAYARGTYDGAASGSELRWVTNSDNRCPDCDDNALEPTVKGHPFPTGQSHPPAHPGCRCLVVVVPAPENEVHAT